MIGIDTTAVIDLFKGVPEVKQKIEELNLPLGVTMLTYLELMFGLDMNTTSHKKEAEYYDKFFETVYLLDLDKPSCKKASEISVSLKKKGQTVGEFDCTIAAIFLKNGISTILTRNKKHFENISQLKVITY